MPPTTVRSSTKSRTRSNLSDRFFVEGRFAPGDSAPVAGEDAHKALNVLRLRDGDSVEIVDSAAHVFDARVRVSGKSVYAELVALRERAPERRLRVTVAQGIPKAQKMDFVVEKLTELGATSIVPLQSERTVVEGVSGNKLDRWKRLAKTAALQSGRTDVPAIEEPLTFGELCGTFASYDCVLFPWELAPRVPPRETLEPLVSRASSILAVIGPEGGFSHAEAEQAAAAGAHFLWLGPQILRTETAGLVALAFVNLLRPG